MLAVIVIIYIILIFPVFVSINAVLSKNTDKLYFGIYIFGIIKILSGYAHTCKDGYIIHLSDKKAVFTPYKSLFEIKDTVAPLTDYHIIKLDWTLEIGSENSALTPLTAAYIINYIVLLTKSVILNRKPYVRINNKTDVYADKNIFNLYIKAVVILNLLMLFISFIKFFTEKFLNAFRKRKQNQ